MKATISTKESPNDYDFTTVFTVEVPHEATKSVSVRNMKAKFGVDSGISLDHSLESGWLDSVPIHPESVAATLLRYAYVAAYTEFYEKKV